MYMHRSTVIARSEATEVNSNDSLVFIKRTANLFFKMIVLQNAINDVAELMKY